MTAFLYVMLILLCLEVVGNLTFLTKGVFPPRSPMAAAANVLINAVLAAWALVLLVGVR